MIVKNIFESLNFFLTAFIVVLLLLKQLPTVFNLSKSEHIFEAMSINVCECLNFKGPLAVIVTF